MKADRDDRPAGEGDVIYGAVDDGSRRYHTTRECPYVVAGVLVLAIDSPRARRLRRDREKCPWCESHTNTTLEGY